MKTCSFVVLLIGMLMPLTASSCLNNGQRISGSKNYITQEVKVEPFNAIKLMGSADIIYQQDSRTHVEIYGSDNIVPLLDTYVEGNTLIVKFKKNTTIWNKGKLEVRVFSPELNKLTINGSGDIKLVNGIQTEQDIELGINGSGNILGEGFSCQQMSVFINGSGNISLQQIQSKECIAKVAGSGNIKLNGETVNAKYSISGSGNIGASALKASNVGASTTGSGCIRCYASGKLVARVKGSGDIAYKGEPKEIDFPRKGLRKLN